MAIYLDSYATTTLAPEARATMLALWDLGGNPQSPHSGGQRAAQALEMARASVAKLLGAQASEITFTSGATEANNLAIAGIARGARDKSRKRILVSAIEHKSVFGPAEALLSEGFKVDVVQVKKDGTIDLDHLDTLLCGETLLASLMLANNETGAIQPIREAAELVHRVGALIHCDAAQAAGKIKVDVSDLDVDYVSVSAHKLHGPVGVGALYRAAGVPPPVPLVYGGGQERGVRAGTVAVPLCGGFGTAADVAIAWGDRDQRHRSDLADTFLQALARQKVHAEFTCAGSATLPGTLALRFPDVDADDLVGRLAHQVHLSTGSACSHGELQTSHVLRALGLSDAQARSCIRICFSRYNSGDEAINAAALVAAACGAARLATGGGHQ